MNFYTLMKKIPLVPLNREWNNEKVYEYFNFTENEINIIDYNSIFGIIIY